MSTLTVKGIEAPTGFKLAMPAGHILQVVEATNTNTANGGFLLTTTSTSYVGAALSATITPSSTSSKILVNVNTSVYRGAPTSCTIYAGGSNIGSANGFLRFTGAEAYFTPVILSTLHSPSTTSAITYQLYAKVTSSTSYFGGDGDVINTITLMEVAG